MSLAFDTKINDTCKSGEWVAAEQPQGDEWDAFVQRFLLKNDWYIIHTAEWINADVDRA